jgi:hypothetical protein
VAETIASRPPSAAQSAETAARTSNRATASQDERKMQAISQGRRPFTGKRPPVFESR